MKFKKDKRAELPSINERIKAERMQLITHEGENVGIVSKKDALKLAGVVGLDLVILSESGGQDGVPIVKIMDYGKSLYKEKKKQAEAKKKQKTIQIKEVKFRPKIGDHDFETKMKRMVSFLQDGKRVKCTLCFRGRENITRESRGQELFARIDNYLVQFDWATDILQEGESKLGQFWSRIYYIKPSKIK